MSHAEFYAGVKEKIQQHGWLVLAISDSPPFYYTIGLHEKGLPELLMIGDIEPIAAQMLINTFAEKMKKLKRPFKDREVIDISGKLPCMAIHTAPVAKTDYCIQAVRYYHDDSSVKVIQILIPDKKGRFPDESGCEAPYSYIPVLKKEKRPLRK